ncbi:MAG: hypothetical protein M0T81_02455 [Thermoplasmatales archaeon]|nr:hypothetical protein [Thermoplasmatales archaeon]
MLTILSIIVMLTIPLFHYQIAPLHRPDEIGFGASEIVIANNTTIGISGFKSNYYLNDNITIQTGRKLTLLDLNLYIQVKEAIITDYGTLCMINTSIHMYSGNESLGTEILGSGNANANLTLENSSWSIPGFISLNHSMDKFSDSSLASGFSAPANQGQTLSMTVVNSTLIAFNSSFAGLMHARPINQIDGANLMYSRNTPFSSDAVIPLTNQVLTKANPLVTRIRVNMTYSGNNPTGENTLNFSYANNLESLKLGNTGSVHNEVSEVFNLTLTRQLSSVNDLIDSFSVSMYVANLQGSNSSVESLNISLLSNDTVSILGMKYFSYEIYNSSVTFARSYITADMNALYLYGNLMNPEHDFIFAQNSSVYLLGSEITGLSGNSSFYALTSSTLLLFSHVYVEGITGSYNDSNFPLTIDPLTYSAYVSSMNGIAQSSLLALNVTEGRLSNQTYAYFLLTDYITGLGKTYTGNYAFDIYNFTYQVGLPGYNYTTLNVISESLHIDLPILTANPVTEEFQMGSYNSFSFNISLVGCNSIQVTLSATIKIGSGKYSTILNESDNISAGSTNVVVRNAYIPYVNAKEISVIVLVHTSKPTYAGSNLTFMYMVPIYMNTALNISYSYSWLRDQDQLMISVGYSLDPGPFNFSISAVTSITTLAGNLTTTEEGKVISSDSGGFLDFIFNLTAIAENATVLFRISNSSLLLENASSVLSFNIAGNTSYFPVSLVYIQVTGLPVDTSWTITIGNVSYSSNVPDLAVKVPNGIYNYSFLQVPGYVSNKSNGIVMATQEEEYLNVTFSQYTYSVVIQETGLLKNATWSAHFSNNTIYSNTSRIFLYLPNGSYNFSVLSSGIKSQNQSYFILISGSSVVVDVTFEKIKHTSLLSSIMMYVYENPFSYLVTLIFALVYWRFYHGSARMCSVCLKPIPRGRLKCQHCKSSDKA